MLNKSRYVIMSLTLISLLMMLTLVFAGCETDDLKAKVDDHISKTDGLESKVDDQIDKTEKLDGKLTFENGDVDGYKLSEELTVVAGDLAAAQKLKADSTLLAENKNSEKSNIENMIAAIGAVTTNDA